ncbi:MAG: hypothetical protein IKP01_02105 [Bacteroidales bacterium]|nr:hypothetical protein [Bacteroidales bacterium]
MSDNRTTDELRKLLDERGVEYETNDIMGASETSWLGFTAFQLTPSANIVMAVTPEQAIAATLGSSTLTTEQVRAAIFNSSSYASYDGAQYYVNGINMQAIADELNALAERTCRIESSYLNDFTSEHECWYEFEMECGYRFTWDEMEPPNHCPNCGAKVIEEVDNADE